MGLFLPEMPPVLSAHNLLGPALDHLLREGFLMPPPGGDSPSWGFPHSSSCTLVLPIILGFFLLEFWNPAPFSFSAIFQGPLQGTHCSYIPLVISGA